MIPSRRTVVAAACATLAAASGWLALARGSAPANPSIQHLVVIFDENVSFDHYFGTYPETHRQPGEPEFTAKPGTPVPNGLTPALLAANPNSANPTRLARKDALTCDQKHGYNDEQMAFNGGLMNKFVEFTAGCADTSLVMDYFDGNTVTALWNLAQNFTLNDAFFGSTFGPSTPGALNLIAGTTHGVTPAAGAGIENGTMTGDPDPAFDDCAAGSARMSGENIGTRMNAKSVTWGWFQGGFRNCAATHNNIGGVPIRDYSPHHEPFMYYESTSNPHHLPPTSVAMIGHTDQAKHQYDLLDFDAAVRAGNLPQVSFLKAAQFEDGHPGSSDPLDEQRFIARTLDELQQSPDWDTTAVVIAYDDSDGWYDHVAAPLRQQSDANSDTPMCKVPAPAAADYKDRCGPGPRLPLLVVSPWTRVNFVNHDLLEQASIIHFIEDNWHVDSIGDQSFDTRAASIASLLDLNAASPAPKVFLDPSTGGVIASPPDVGSSPDFVPTPVPTASPAPTATATATAVPKPPKLKPRLTITAKRKGKKVTLKVRVAGLSAKNGRITLSAKLVRKRRTVATSGSARARSGRATLVLKSKKPVAKGTYTLSVRVKQGSRSATVTRTLKLR